MSTEEITAGSFTTFWKGHVVRGKVHNKVIFQSKLQQPGHNAIVKSGTAANALLLWWLLTFHRGGKSLIGHVHIFAKAWTQEDLWCSCHNTMAAA